VASSRNFGQSLSCFCSTRLHFPVRVSVLFLLFTAISVCANFLFCAVLYLRHTGPWSIDWWHKHGFKGRCSGSQAIPRMYSVQGHQGEHKFHLISSRPGYYLGTCYCYQPL
jgi:hypothetical protein